MQKILNIAALILLLSYHIVAQNKEKTELKVKFGKISDEEIAMKQYEKEPDAAAVYLFDKATLSYAYDEDHFFVPTFERHVRLKIFKKEAYDLANFRLVYRSSGSGVQSISDIKAISYNTNNGKLIETKLSDDNITVEALTKNTSIKKITMPNVREGTIIELKYKISSNGVAYIPDWNFQENIPVIWSEYEASIPEYLDFLPISQGNTPYLVNTKEESTDNRLYDIDFGEPRDAIFQIKVALPEGYKIEDMPKTARFLLGDNALKFEYLIRHKDNNINIMTKLNIKQTIFEPEDYKELKQAYAKIIAKLGEQIVLSKI